MADAQVARVKLKLSLLRSQDKRHKSLILDDRIISDQIALSSAHSARSARGKRRFIIVRRRLWLLVGKDETQLHQPKTYQKHSICLCAQSCHRTAEKKILRDEDLAALLQSSFVQAQSTPLKIEQAQRTNGTPELMHIIIVRTREERYSYISAHHTTPCRYLVQAHAKMMSKWYDKNEVHARRLLLWHLDLSAVDLVNNVVRRLTVDRAPNRLCRAEDLLRTVRERLGERF